MIDSYPLEKLNNVLNSLTAGEGDIKERLCDVQSDLLAFTEDDLPEELQLEWKGIILELTKKGSYKDLYGNNELGAIQNSLIGISRKKVSKIVKQIIEFHSKLESYDEEFKNCTGKM